MLSSTADRTRSERMTYLIVVVVVVFVAGFCRGLYPPLDGDDPPSKRGRR
jgi:hypothetical protein